MPIIISRTKIFMVSDIYVMQGLYLWGRSAPVKSTDTSQLVDSMTGQYILASNLLRVNKHKINVSHHYL